MTTAPAHIHSYHAHIYYDPAGPSKDEAARLRAAMGERYAVQMGRWHDVPVGPHAGAMYQVAFATDLFADLVPWLLLARGSLTVLVHPNTGAPRADHMQHALWLGQVLPLKAETLPEHEAPEDIPPIVPNTTPAQPR